jgi:cullin-4
LQPEESQKTNKAIEGDRKHYLDAAIVRIMKGKKEMSYEQLKTATIDAVKNHFVPSVDTIKKRVDSLVESDYLKRSEEDRNFFHYVA